MINPKIPFIRREAVRALRGPYPSHEVAVPQIERAIRDALNARMPQGLEEVDLRTAIAVTQSVYRHNVFPAMKIDWGTYSESLGHTTSLGASAATTRTTRRGTGSPFVRIASRVT